MVKNLPANAGNIRDAGLISGLGRSPGGGNGHPLHCSCLKNPVDRGTWQITVHWVAKNWTWLKWLSTHAKECIHHNLKTLVLWHSSFFIVQFSHLYMATGKTIALTIKTFISKVMLLLFNTLSRFVRTFFSRSKCHLISWLLALSAVILSPRK